MFRLLPAQLLIITFAPKEILPVTAADNNAMPPTRKAVKKAEETTAEEIIRQQGIETKIVNTEATITNTDNPAPISDAIRAAFNPYAIINSYFKFNN